MRIGGHFPISKGLVHALKMTHDSGGNTLQLFTKNPGQWNAREIKSEEACEFIEKAEELDIAPLIVHDSYLINLASPDESLLEKSRQAFMEEMERAEMLGAKYLVTHMGVHKGAGDDRGLKTLAESVTLCLEKTKTKKVQILLETTAGQGTQLGYRFEHIGRVLKLTGNHSHVGACMDTCHIFAAGYDLSTEEGFKRTIDEFQREIGWEHLKLIHANDAKKPLGSRVDRHEYIGEGYIGREAFERMITNPLFREIPFIIETKDPEKMHRVYIGMLKGMTGESAYIPTISTKASR